MAAGAFLPLLRAGALSAGCLHGLEEFLGDECVMRGLDGVDPLLDGVVCHVGAVAEGDVVVMCSRCHTTGGRTAPDAGPETTGCDTIDPIRGKVKCPREVR